MLDERGNERKKEKKKKGRGQNEPSEREEREARKPEGANPKLPSYVSERAEKGTDKIKKGSKCN